MNAEIAFQFTIITIHISCINDPSDYICNGSQSESYRQSDVFLQAAHQKSTNSDANIGAKRLHKTASGLQQTLVDNDQSQITRIHTELQILLEQVLRKIEQIIR